MSRRARKALAIPSPQAPVDKPGTAVQSQMFRIDAMGSRYHTASQSLHGTLGPLPPGNRKASVGLPARLVPCWLFI
jgi:hypothetical protein